MRHPHRFLVALLLLLTVLVGGPRSATAAPAGQAELVSLEFRYGLAEAGEVYLVWGLDGWQPVPEEQRPAGTVVENGVMHTPMERDGDGFLTTLLVSTGAPLDYGFQTRSTRDGAAIEWLWDGNYQLIPSRDETLEVPPLVELVAPAAPVEAAPLLRREFRYRAPGEAGEVFLVWGLDGWQLVPEEQRPTGTVVESGVMYTPMERDGDGFAALLQLPAGSTLNYGFQIRAPGAEPVWDGDYQIASAKDELIELAAPGAPPPAPEVPPVAQELRYRSAEAGEVFLVWGVDGWGLLPEELRPAGTVVKDGVMWTPMVLAGDLFAARLDVPLGAEIDYGFMVTQTPSGAAVQVWDAGGAEKYTQQVAKVGVFEIAATPHIVRNGGAAGFNTVLQIQGVLALLAAVLALLAGGAIYRRWVTFRAGRVAPGQSVRS